MTFHRISLLAYSLCFFRNQKCNPHKYATTRFSYLFRNTPPHGLSERRKNKFTQTDRFEGSGDRKLIMDGSKERIVILSPCAASRLVSERNKCSFFGQKSMCFVGVKRRIWASSDRKICIISQMLRLSAQHDSENRSVCGFKCTAFICPRMNRRRLFA